MLPVATRVLLRGRLRNLELAAGPFYDPDRPRPAVSQEECLGRLDHLELLLTQLRRALWRVVGVSACVALLAASILSVAAVTQGFPAGGAAVAVVFVSLSLGFNVFAAFLRWWDAAPHNVMVDPEVTLSPFTFGAPDPRRIIEAVRSLYDGLVGVTDADAAVVIERVERDRPLTSYGWSVWWTAVPAHLRDEVA